MFYHSQYLPTKVLYLMNFNLKKKQEMSVFLQEHLSVRNESCM